MPNEIQQPKPFDLVGNPILICGIGSGFEATLQFRVHDGHDERTGHFNVGQGADLLETRVWDALSDRVASYSASRSFRTAAI